MTPQRLRNFALFGLILLLLYFNISDRISLDRSEGQRTSLLHQLIAVEKQVEGLNKKIGQDQLLIAQLRTLIMQENQIIVKLGGKPVPLPTSLMFTQPPTGNNSREGPEPAPSPGVNPTPQPTAKPSLTTSPSPNSPLEPVCRIIRITCGAPLT